MNLPPIPDPPFPGHEASRALNAAYEERRRRWRESNPIVSREEIAALEEAKEGQTR